MQQPAPALSLVSQSNFGDDLVAAPMTAAARAKASAAQARQDASEALDGLIASISKAIAEAQEVGSLETLPAATREEIKKFAANSTGSLDLINRAAR